MIKSLIGSFLFSTAGIFILISPGSALAYCYKPSVPYKPYSFTSSFEVDSYNRKVDQYNNDLRRYQSCVRSEIDTYRVQYQNYLNCEARNFGSSYSSFCSKPTKPSF